MLWSASESDAAYAWIQSVPDAGSGVATATNSPFSRTIRARRDGHALSVVASASSARPTAAAGRVIAT